MCLPAKDCCRLPTATRNREIWDEVSMKAAKKSQLDLGFLTSRSVNTASLY